MNWIEEDEMNDRLARAWHQGHTVGAREVLNGTYNSEIVMDENPYE